MKYSFRQLEVFLATAREESISRAAASLAMSQSAASSALADLERQFAIRLFDRVGKRLQINDLGLALWPRAEALLQQAQVLEQMLAGQQEISRVRVGATLTIGNYLVVPLMARFMEQYPGARVSLEVDNTEHIVEAVRSFRLDVGLIEGDWQDPELLLTPWREDELVVFCAPEYPLAKAATLDDRQLREAVWILREKGSGTRQTFDRAMHGLLPELHVLLELQHTEAIKRAVEAGLGIGCLSRVALEDAFARARFVPLAVPQRSFHRYFYFALHRQKYVSQSMQRWLSLCRAMTSATD